jgi:phospholipid/cholesterol/gamma-HCH transport system substrate-binding protein
MRRIALILASLCAVPAVLVAAAGADDDRTYQAELFNAFGLVEGSELRVAGVKAGTVTNLDVTPQKTALVSFEVGPDFPEFNADASCSSEPQSLIAEYFLDCQPGSSDQPLDGPIPAARNQTTVQNDLVQNTLREPFKRRFQLIINEFGTALVGNPENLNAAIRSGAPALRELRKVLQILGRQNRIIAELNVNNDTIFQKLADRREDVVRFIDKAEDTARVSAERRAELSQDFDLLDDFLFRLRPVMVQLGHLAREQTPLLTDLKAAAPGLNRLAGNLPHFNNGARISLKSLGRASDVGKRALAKSKDEIAQLNQTSQKAYPASDIVAKFLESLDDPRQAVEEDCDARVDLRDQPGEADRRVALLEDKLGVNLHGDRSCDPSAPAGTGNPGYTGLEGVLNYVYVQTLTLNQFDNVGHALHFMIVGASDASEGGGACGSFASGPDYPKAAEFGAGRTTDVRKAVHCAAALGDTQPDINFPLNLPRYDGSVCPDGSTNHALCDPNISTNSLKARSKGLKGSGSGSDSNSVSAPEVDHLLQLPGVDPKKQKQQLRDLLGLPPDVKLPPALQDGLGPSAGDQAATDDLLNFLIGS